jgi:hypothetical protein
MKKLMWLLPLVILIVSCNGEGEEESDYLPLAVGNQWNYDMTYSMMMTSDTLQNTGTSVTEITRQTVLNNNVEVLEQVTTNTWDDTLMNPNSIDTTYLYKTPANLLVYDDLADTDPDTSLVLPILAGNTWVVYADTMDTLTAEVLGREAVTVPAGSYNSCWNVEYTSLGQTQHDWFAIDVGIVKYSMIIDQPPVVIEFTKELTSFDLQ